MWTYLLTSTEFVEVFKAPVFVAHYYEHKSETPNLSLLEFVVLHYFSGDPRDDDYARDEQLPFRSHQESLIGVVFSVLPPATVAILLKSPDVKLSYFDRNQEGKTGNFPSDVWQPPKTIG